MTALLLLTVIVLVTKWTAHAQFDNSTCGIDKGCMWSPPGCDPTISCNMEFSWKVVSNNDLQIELSGVSANGTNNYVAVGFSHDQIMGNESVTDCTFSDVGVSAHLSYNDGPINVPITDYPHLGNHVQLTNASNNNNRLYCVVRQMIVPQESDSRIPPLNGNKWFIFMAVGHTSDQALNAPDQNFPNFYYVGYDSVSLTDPINNQTRPI